MGMLPGLSAVSAVSGGSLVAGLLGTRWERLEFQNGVATHFPEEVAGPTLSFCGVNVDCEEHYLRALDGFKAPWKDSTRSTW